MGRERERGEGGGSDGNMYEKWSLMTTCKGDRTARARRAAYRLPLTKSRFQCKRASWRTHCGRFSP